jgi:hypothetical protein
MTVAWPLKQLAEIAPLVRRPIMVDPEVTYREIGIRSFGRGVFHKLATTGLEIGECFPSSPEIFCLTSFLRGKERLR